MVNAQKWLESQAEYNTKEKRERITELDISKKELVGELDLNEFINLEKLNCSRNQLTSINLDNCKKLRVINCGGNKLTGLDLTGLNELEEVVCYGNYLEIFDYSSLNPEKLTYLDISSSKLPKQDLTVFSEFTNLETLWIGSSDKDIQEGFSVNQIYGSLEPLKNLTKLQTLHISNTDISEGLEHLPNSVEEIYCSGKERPESKVSAIENLLKNSEEFISSGDGYVKKFISKNIQEYLNNTYNKNAEEIKIGDNLQLSEKGTLVISDYPELEIIRATGSEKINNITQVTISNCPSLKKLDIRSFFTDDTQQLEIKDCPSLEILECDDNQLTSLYLTNCPNLTKLYCEKNELTDLDLSNCPNLEIIYCEKNKLTNLEISNCANLKRLVCSTNQLTELNLSENKELTELWCYHNQLTQLTLPNLTNLEKLICHTNNLTNLDFLNNCNPEKLERLSLGDNNFPAQDLTIFSQFKELKELRMDGIDKPSHFTGSCKPLQKLEKLEKLDIRGTDITHGLEYLPESVKNIDCAPMRPNAQVIDIYEELQPFGGDITKWREVKLEKKDYLSLAPLMPAELRNKENNLTKYFKKLSIFAKGKDLEDFNYTSLYFNHWKLTNPLSPHESPLRLYQFQNDNQNDKVILAQSIKQPYAILSYVWGERGSVAMENSLTKRDQGAKTISNSASKAINKALKALTIINNNLSTPINYLWVDQLCMNQEDQHEKSLEVPKMGKYYDNASLTLIAMDDKVGDTSEVLEVLKKVVNSEWFSRSWTFQEGWLSKWTVFMFDDKLIDGRAMAGTWALNQLSYVDGGKYLSRSEFDRGTKKIATPVGWVYYRHGYNSEKDKVELTLTQALQAIKYRQRTEPLDGVYSILGLLPYGKEVPVSYSQNNTPELALQEVMKVAIKNGYVEPLSWLGISNPKRGLCWMPQIDKNGSTSVMGSMERVNSIYKVAMTSTNTNLILLTNQGLKFTIVMPHYLIQKDNQQSIHKLESGFEIEGGLYRKEVIVKPRGMNEEIKVSLLGTRESLENATKGNILVVLHKEWFGTNKLLALLVKETKQMYDEDEKETMHICHRLGLVELVDSEGIKFTIWVTNFKKKTILGSEYQAQIEIPAKK